jgi:exodeoxyribonuclease-5
MMISSLAQDKQNLLSLSGPQSEQPNLPDNRQQLFSHFPFSLTEQQQEALLRLWIFLHSEEAFFLLGGFAGTGKSTIVFSLVKQLITNNRRVALTAPTNKAVAILKKMAVNNGIFGVSCLTIHQLLGLGMVNRGAEKVLQPTSPSSIHLYDVVFLDECSMVGTELWSWIERYFETSLLTRRKLVLMGDPAQLNPIGEKQSPTFKIQNQAILTQVVRQAGESPLLDFIMASRQAVNSKTTLFQPFSNYKTGDKSQGAFQVKPNTLIKYAIQKVKGEFNQNPDCFRILCYTNKQVDYYNQVIREAILGQDAPRFVPGERLITKKPVVAPDSKTIILPTSVEITVTDIAETKHYGYQAYQLNVVTDEGGIRQFFVLHESEQKRYEVELNQKLKNAQNNPVLWRKYYWFRDDLFAQVSNCISLTVHNSQGSTFEEGAVDSNDLIKRLFVGEETEPQKRKEYNRLWYVGSSRFRQRVLFLRATF